jgi:hypothetical protein
MTIFKTRDNLNGKAHSRQRSIFGIGYATVIRLFQGLAPEMQQPGSGLMKRNSLLLTFLSKFSPDHLPLLLPGLENHLVRWVRIIPFSLLSIKNP